MGFPEVMTPPTIPSKLKVDTHKGKRGVLRVNLSDHFRDKPKDKKMVQIALSLGLA